MLPAVKTRLVSSQFDAQFLGILDRKLSNKTLFTMSIFSVNKPLDVAGTLASIKVERA